MEEQFFIAVCKKLGLGDILEPPLTLYGGLMHKMFRLKTSTGIFAVKLLNPIIMKREDALSNFKMAESLELKLQQANLPIVPALVFCGEKMQCLQNQYFYIFEWVQGKSLKPYEVKKEHCLKMGSILAQIHNIEIKEANGSEKILNIDWEYFASLALKGCPEIAAFLNDNKHLLMSIQKECNNASKKLPKAICICHGDMDSKNVLWKGNAPKIIDLECLGYKSPHMELFELALSWAGLDDLNLELNLVEAFIKAYLAECKHSFNMDWTVLHTSCSINHLKWLEYNIKRALMIECGSNEEKNLGIAQANKTMQLILYYQKIKEPLIKALTKR